MTLDQFWEIVDGAHRASGGDMEKKCDLLDAELRRLSLDEVRSFHAHFTDCLDRAYTWPIWAAAYIMGGGCSDDSFWDFRSTLISMGRDTFERAMADPESLADLDLEDGSEMQWEGYQYVPSKVEEALSGGQKFPRPHPHPKEPSGDSWDEGKVAELYPKLAKRYGYTG
jgi:hypothetical protein